MDLYTANAAQIIHHQEARSFERQLEYRRVARERAASVVVPSPRSAAPRGFSLVAIFRGHHRDTQCTTTG